MHTNEKQIAVRYALQAFLEPRQLDQAMNIWHGNYADKPTFALQGFVRECSVLFSLENSRNDMYLSLVQHLSTIKMHPKHGTIDMPSPVAINAAPSRAMLTDKSKATEQYEPESVKAFTVLKMVIEQLFGLSGSAAAGEIRTYLQNNLASLQLPKQTSNTLKNWLSGKAIDNDLLEMTVPAMRRLVTLAYVALCEHFGPVRADGILDGAIRYVSQTIPGRRFHPQKLL